MVAPAPGHSQRLILFACAISFLAPAAIIFLISAFVFTDLTVPELVMKPTPSENSALVLLELDKVLLSMAVGLGVASLWVYRRPLRKGYRTASLLVLLGGLTTGLCSIYAGLRFIFDMGQQLQYIPLNFELLSYRFYFQGAFLALQLSFLCLSAALYHLVRDRRHDREV